MEPFRVLHVVTIMNMGGIEVLLMNLYRNIDKRVVQFDFLVHRQARGIFDDEIEKMGGKIHRIIPYNSINIWEYNKQLLSFFNNHKEYNIVHSHINTFSNRVLKIAKKSGVRTTIAHAHTSTPLAGPKRIIKKLTSLNIEKNCDYKFACSHEAAKWVFGKYDSEVQIFNNAIDALSYEYNPNKRSECREKMGIHEKSFVVGHVGRFDFLKNQNFVVDIFNEIYKKNRRSLLLLVGSGILEKKIMKKVEDLHISEAVRFMGLRSDVNNLLQAMDIFVFPSLREGVPVTLVESQAAGLKTIVADTITEQIKLTDLLEFVSLDQPASYWGQRVIKYADGYERRNTYSDICNSGYDVRKNAKWLESFYMSVL